MTINEIQKNIAKYYKINGEELQGKSRKRDIVEVRQIAIYLCKKYTASSLKEIGQSFGKRDHSTVLYANRKVKSLILSNKEYNITLQKIIKDLGIKI